MDTRIRVLDGIDPNPDCLVQIRRYGRDHYMIELVDYFISATGQPFMRVEMDQATLAMTLGGACSAVHSNGASFALLPSGREMRVSFQSEDWPFPAEWRTPREEFNAAVMAML